MKEFIIYATVTGRASCVIEAESEEEAREKFKTLDIVRDTDELIEWAFDDIQKVEAG